MGCPCVMLVPSIFGEESDLLECFVWCKVFLFSDMVDDVDGRNPANQLRLVVYLIIYKVLAPSQVVVWDFFHQQ